MSVDAVGDFLTIIRNGLMVSSQSVLAPHSKLKFEIGRILLEEGFVSDVQVIEDGPVKKKIKVTLKYVDGESVIHEIKRASVPGRRAYSGSRSVTPVAGGLGISVLTTSKGVLTDKVAKRQGVGGEVICTVW